MNHEASSPADYRESYPEWINYYEKGVARLEALSLLGDPDLNPFQVFGDEVLGYVESLIEVGFSASEFKKRLPFYKDDWSRSGLTDPTIAPVIEETLRAHELCTEDGIKSLVVIHLGHRLGLSILDDVEWMEKHFSDRLLSSLASDREEQLDFIAYLADISEEVLLKRQIDYLRLRSEENLGDVPQMTAEQWDEFLATPRGLQLGIFSTVEWLTRPREGSLDHLRGEILARHKRMLQNALVHYQRDQDYQKFASWPRETVAQAVREFLGQLFNKEYLEAGNFPRLCNDALWFCLDEIRVKGLEWFLREGWRLIEKRDTVLVLKIKEWISDRVIREGEEKKEEIERSIESGAGMIYHALTIQEQESKGRHRLPLVSEGEFKIFSQSFGADGEFSYKDFEEFLYDFNRELFNLFHAVIGGIKTRDQAGDNLGIDLQSFYVAVLTTYCVLASSAESLGLEQSLGLDPGF